MQSEWCKTPFLRNEPNADRAKINNEEIELKALNPNSEIRNRLVVFFGSDR